MGEFFVLFRKFTHEGHTILFNIGKESGIGTAANVGNIQFEQRGQVLCFCLLYTSMWRFSIAPKQRIAGFPTISDKLYSPPP